MKNLSYDAEISAKPKVRIEHIALYVNDLDAARDFFVNYLGAESNSGYHNTRTDFRSYFLTFGDGARLELMNKPNMPDSPKDPSRTGYAHIAFSVGSREKVDELTTQLKADGYQVLSGPRTTGDGYYESSIVAIEQNLIEITE
jgi:lactoylglutathione lyase